MFLNDFQGWWLYGDIWRNGQTASYCPCGEMNSAVSSHIHTYTSKRHYNKSNPNIYYTCSFQSALIFKDIKVRGFWVTQWKRDHSNGQSLFHTFRQVNEPFFVCLFVLNKLQLIFRKLSPQMKGH